MHSGLTGTQVLRYLNRMLGTVVQDLEISQEEMMRVVYEESLITYSKYFPYIYKSKLKAANRISPRSNTYRFDDGDHLEILGIRNYISSSRENHGSDRLALTSNPIATQLSLDYSSAVRTPSTFLFEPPNLVSVYPNIMPHGDMLIRVKAVHPMHFKTIPMNMRDQFLKLALYDVLQTLYPLRHRFESMNTPYGSIQPFMEMVDAAESNRNDLISEWASSSQKSAYATRVVIA